MVLFLLCIVLGVVRGAVLGVGAEAGVERGVVLGLGGVFRADILVLFDLSASWPISSFMTAETLCCTVSFAAVRD